MIKIFRRIRKGLLAENKFSKYLRYTIGEIALEVIGVFLPKFINKNGSLPSWEGIKGWVLR